MKQSGSPSTIMPMAKRCDVCIAENVLHDLMHFVIRDVVVYTEKGNGMCEKKQVNSFMSKWRVRRDINFSCCSNINNCIRYSKSDL